MNELANMLDALKAAAAKEAATGADPSPFLAGTFAMYADPSGDIIIVANIPDGDMEGTHRHRLPAAMVRMAGTFAASGGKLTGLFRRG